MSPTVNQIISAAAILGGVTTEKLAILSGIRASRVQRVRTGRAVPTAGEIGRLLAGAGVQEQPLTAVLGSGDIREAVGTACGQDVSTTLVALIAAGSPAGGSLPGRRPGSIGATRASLIIDKLSATFFVPSERRFRNWIDSKVEVEPDDSPRRIYNYRGRGDGVLLQFEPTLPGVRFARLEINPANTKTDWALVQEFCRNVSVPDSRVTRVDPAADLPLAMGEAQAFSDRSQKLSVVLGPGGVETIYVGAKGGKRQLRQYDKSQLGWRSARGGAPRTRFEAQVRQTDLALPELHRLPNPFTTIKLLPLRATGLSLAERLLVQHAQLYGLLAVKAELGPAEFKQLVSAIERAGSLVVPHPRDLFEARWPSLCRALLQRMGV